MLKEIQREMGGVENVEKLVGENEEAIAFQEEVAEMLQGRMTRQEEEEVEEELEALERERERVGGKVDVGRLPNAPEGIKEETKLPDAPGHVPVPAAVRRVEEKRQALAA